MGRFKTSAVIIHVAAWLLFLSFPTVFMLQSSRHSLSLALIINPWSYLQFIIVFAGVYYLNAYYLFPKFYFHKKYLIYGLCCLTLLILVFTIRPFDKMNSQFRVHRKPRPEIRHFESPIMHFDLMSIFIFVTLMGMGTALRSIKEWQLTEKRAILAEAAHANATLSFLKAQINPHFLYNNLNNIYTLCLTGNPNAADSIMKLSNIMRYVTDEAEANFVPLQREIDCMNNFIELQKLRLGKKTRLDYKITGDASGHLISPLILMTFIENVFKYGLSSHHPTSINISLNILPGKLVFHTQNHVFLKPNQQDRTGLGISNTKRRLALLYPGKHELNILNKNNLFIVNLILFL